MDDEILGFKEAADFLGIGTKVFSRILVEEKIPARKLGVKWVFSKQALVEWVASGDSQSYAGRSSASDIEKEQNKADATERTRKQK